MSALSEAPGRVAGPPLSERPGRTLVLALGSPLRGDDGVGAAVLRELAAGAAIGPDVDLVDGGTPGLETALLLQGYQRAIIIDAADLGRRPGDWARIDVDGHGFLGCREAFGGDGREPSSVHQAGLAEALALGAALGVIPESVTVYGIQTLECGWSAGLSRPVSAAVADVARAIRNDIGSLMAAERAG